MLRIFIQGMKDGRHEVSITSPVSDAESIYPEFTGEISVVGTLTKIGDRITVQATASAHAKLVCDYSLQEYIEAIEAPISTSYLLDSELYSMRDNDNNDDAYEVHVMRSDEKNLDITEEVAQELSVRLPLKRIAPEFRNKEIGDIVHDEHLLRDGKTEGSGDVGDSTDERWAALKNIKFNN